MKKIELDREVLESCVKRGLSQLEMAVELNTSQAVVNARLREYGLQSKGGKKATVIWNSSRNCCFRGAHPKRLQNFFMWLHPQ